MLFENQLIDLQQLPQSEAIPFQQLAPSFPRAEHIGNAIFFILLGIGLTVAFWVWNLAAQSLWFWALPLAWALLWIVTSVMVHLAYQIQGYALREKDILYRSGVIFRKTTVIPFNRVQHCEVKQGPVERLFHLRTLEVYTAGGQSSDLSIPGLPAELAPQLKEYIIKRTAAHEQ